LICSVSTFARYLHVLREYTSFRRLYRASLRAVWALVLGGLSSFCLAQAIFEPYIGPYLTLISTEADSDKHGTPKVLDPATNMIVNYELAELPKTFVGAVYYRKLGDKSWLHAVEKDSIPMRKALGKVHHVHLTGLAPASTYEYRIVGPSGSLGKTYQFSTLAAAADESRFVIVGDMQDELRGQRWKEIADNIVTQHGDDFDFVISVGDMVKDDIPHNGDRFFWWKVFFDHGRALFASKPFLPSIGNHDTPGNPEVEFDEYYWSNAEDTTSFKKYFNIRYGSQYANYYRFSIGNACFVSVNSEIPVFHGRNPSREGSMRRVENQYTWLSESLDAMSDCAWRFSYWHVPAVNPAGGKDEVQYMKPYAYLLDGAVDWVFSGHTHEYQRVKPMRARQNETTPVEAPLGGAVSNDPPTSSNHDFDFSPTRYGRKEHEGTGYLIAPPSGQWPRALESDDMDQLAFYPHNEHGVAFEVGFTLVKTNRLHLDMKTYGFGAVGNQVQPLGYRKGKLRKKILLDAISYDKE